MYRYPNISHLNTGEGFEKKIMMGSGTVTARDILECEGFSEHGYKIPFIFGIDDGFNPVSCDLARVSSILISGSTGRGQINVLHSFISSLILTTPPEEARLVLLDPLGVDLAFMEKLPHCIFFGERPIGVRAGISWLMMEMTRRIKRLVAADVSSIDQYTGGDMPRIVVCASNFDMPLSKMPELVEDEVRKLLLYGRAVGIHFVITSIDGVKWSQKLDILRGFGAILALKHTTPNIDILPRGYKTNFDSWGVGYLSVGNRIKRVHIVCEGYSSGISALIKECADYNPDYAIDSEIKEELKALREQAKGEIDRLVDSKREKNIMLLIAAAISFLHDYEEINEPLICHLLCCMHEEALEVIEELLSLGIIEKNKNGRYKVINLD